MPLRRSSPDHQEAVSRRLALLSAELAAGGTPTPPPEPPVPVPQMPVPPVPVPGRHAERRLGPKPGVLPATFRGPVALGSAQLAVVAVLVAAGLAITCWWLVRGDAKQVQAPDIVPVTAAAAPAATPAAIVEPAATTSGTPSAETVTVDVAGKVRRPGIVVLDVGSRVVDALEAAGGARSGIDLSGLNLARLLVDGEQVLVGVPAPAGVAAAAASGEPAGALVNLNTADQAGLEALPEVGPVTAQAILAWRDEHGGFTAVEELLEVDGIGDATMAQLAPLVTV